MPKNRPYLYYDQTASLCEYCFRRIEAKHVIQNNEVWMHKWCPKHGQSKVLIATDAEYWRLGREVYIKDPEMPERFNTKMNWGCPYDCGLCPDHMQHSCLTIVEITEHCNLSCPVCYAESSPKRMKHYSLDEIETMLDAIVANEKNPDVVQISGGEPTLHPQFFEILDEAKKRPIRHLMLNTNGLRIANEEGFADKLAAYAPSFEVYLQFDSFEQAALKTLRGADLRKTREKAIAELNRVGLSTTLVVTVAKGVNDHELGAIIEYATKQPCIRGVTFQPIQFAGRLEGIGTEQRLTQTEVRQAILAQTDIFTPEDIIPVPCNPDALSMGYALKLGDEIVPLTGFIEPEVLLEGARNTIVFEADNVLKDKVFKLFSTNHSPESQSHSIADLLCCLPKIEIPKTIGYENVFRILIMSFIDAVNFDVRAMKKSCVHIAQRDGTIIPFETCNLFHRNAEQKALLNKRRHEINIMFRNEETPLSDGTKGFFQDV